MFFITYSNKDSYILMITPRHARHLVRDIVGYCIIIVICIIAGSPAVKEVSLCIKGHHSLLNGEFALKFVVFAGALITAFYILKGLGTRIRKLYKVLQNQQ